LRAVRIIGITGTNGAGKGTTVEYLLSRHNFRHYSVRGYLNQRLREAGLPLDRDHLVQLANSIRAERGPAAMAELLFEEAERQGGDCVLESIRTMGEIEALRAKGAFLLLAVDAPAALRYARIRLRDSETDRISEEQFAAEEQREMSSTDPNRQNIASCMERADYRLWNGGSFEALYAQIEQALQHFDAMR
jgi:dephospho-CoA kinase